MSDSNSRINVSTILSIVLCAVTIAFLIGALVLNIFTSFNFWWLFFCALPLPVTVCFISAFKVSKGKIALIIVSVALCVLIPIGGLISGIVKLSSDHIALVNLKIDYVYSQTGIRIPTAPFDAYTDENRVFDSNNRKFIEVENFGFYLNDKQMDAFLDEVIKNENWISDDGENSVADHFSPFVDYYDEVFLIYNVTEKTYNCISQSGTVCDYIIISFDPSYGSLNVYIFSK